jgi:hypothetical protein
MIGCIAQLCEGKSKFVLVRAMKTYGWVEVQLNSRWVVCWKLQPLYCQGQRLCNLLCRTLDGPHIWSGHFIKETNPLPLLGFRQHFLICPSYNQVTIVTSPTRKETSYSDRRFWFSYILFIVIIGGILVLFITRLASNKIFSPSNKIHREVGRAKDLSAPLYWLCYASFVKWKNLNFSFFITHYFFIVCCFLVIVWWWF